jgi:hypothetical protein
MAATKQNTMPTSVNQNIPLITPPILKSAAATKKRRKRLTVWPSKHQLMLT